MVGWSPTLETIHQVRQGLVVTTGSSPSKGILMPFTFVANLKPYTFHRGRGVRRFDAYLLSVDFSGGDLEELAEAVVRDDAKLCADNGNVDAIRQLIHTFGPPAQALDARRKNEEAALGRYARPGELSEALAKDYQALAKNIREAAATATPEPYIRKAVAGQHAMKASYAIGMEDLTIATLTGLSIEPEYAMLSAQFYAERNARAVELARRTIRGDFGEPPAQVFAGVHALDYDQAVDAGRLVGEAGLSGIATGLVGALRDKNSVDFRVENQRLAELGETTARPYLRVLEIAAGLHVGFHQATGRRPDFHALGAGSPILLPLLGLLSHDDVFTATDSTAPIVDGWSGATISLYVDDPAPLKLRPERIAQSWLEGGRGWDCDCANCRGFEEAYPADLAAAARWWAEQGKPKITKAHLGRHGGLSTHSPYLGHHPDVDIRTAAGLARVGHNHSVLQRLERVVREAVARDDTAVLHDLVKAYLAFPGLDRWRASARHALLVAEEGRRQIAGHPE